MTITISDLVRTMSSYFRIGNIRVKDSSGVVQFRNAADSAYAASASAQVRIQGTNATNAIILDAPGSLAGSLTLTFPGTMGTTGQVLSLADGSGTLAFTDTVANADLTQVAAFTQATSSPLTVFTPPANSRIHQVIVEVTSAAAGGNPTVEVGVSGDADAYMAATQNDLKSSGDSPYIVTPLADVGGTPDPVIVTITPDSQSFTGNVYVIYTNPS